MKIKKPLTDERKRQRALYYNYKYSKYLALLQALAFCDFINPTLFNRLKKRTLCKK